MPLTRPPTREAPRSFQAVVPWSTGRYYNWQSSVGGTQGAAITPVGGTLYVAPLCAPNDVSIDCLIIQCTVSPSSASYRLGIYDAGADGNPGDLVLETATIGPATMSVGVIQVTIPATPLVGRKWYFLAILMTAAGTLPSLKTATAASSPRPYGSPTGDDFPSASSPARFPTLTGLTVGPLPNPFGVPSGFGTVACPLIGVRVV